MWCSGLHSDTKEIKRPTCAERGERQAYLFLTLGLQYTHTLHPVACVARGTGGARETGAEVAARRQAVTGPAIQTLKKTNAALVDVGI